MTFVARISIDRETIRLTRDGDGFDIRLTLTPVLAFTDSDAVIESAENPWR